MGLTRIRTQLFQFLDRILRRFEASRGMIKPAMEYLIVSMGDLEVGCAKGGIDRNRLAQKFQGLLEIVLSRVEDRLFNETLAPHVKFVGHEIVRWPLFHRGFFLRRKFTAKLRHNFFGQAALQSENVGKV